MTTNNTVSVFRFEYEILPNMNPWNVFIAAFNHQEAHQHLQKTVNKPIRITSSTMVCRLDDVAQGVRQNIISAFLNTTTGKNVTTESKKETAEPEVDEVEKKKPIKK